MCWVSLAVVLPFFSSGAGSSSLARRAWSIQSWSISDRSLSASVSSFGQERQIHLPFPPTLSLRGGGRGLLGGIRKEQRIFGKAHKVGLLRTLRKTEEARAASKHAKSVRLALEHERLLQPDRPYAIMRAAMRKHGAEMKLYRVERERAEQDYGESGPGSWSSGYHRKLHEDRTLTSKKFRASEAHKSGKNSAKRTAMLDRRGKSESEMLRVRAKSRG